MILRRISPKKTIFRIVAHKISSKSADRIARTLQNKVEKNKKIWKLAVNGQPTLPRDGLVELKGSALAMLQRRELTEAQLRAFKRAQ